ncbi:thioether cross-link-forming SCIFF peptide maturase [Ruminococcaceae bacterium OttesenSCG-928-I18]|nr:thioether cross-link-forming SCIFF peptide maturase [Ruminococcaceae bacterium OttesenSCG-928-I18]
MIHAFQKMGYYFVLDVGSGAVHIVDEIAYDLLNTCSRTDLLEDRQSVAASLPKHSPEALAETQAELRRLIEEGLLYSDDDYEEFREALGVAPVKALCLHVAHDCNLRCRYCFASTGDFGGARTLMDLDTAKGAIDLLIRLSEGRKNLEVDFFGGEPLLNFGLVRDTVQYARSIEKQHGKHFRFTITTNGLGLDEENMCFINREMDNIVLSLDGRKEINDAMRYCPNGKGSYDLIVPKLQELIKERGHKEYYIRGTYTRQNLDFDRDVLHLHSLGFQQLSVEPVVGPQEDAYSIREEDIPFIAQSYDRLLESMLKSKENQPTGDFHFFHFLLDLDNGPCAIKRLKGCGSGNEYLAVTPEGELYPCHQFVDNKNFLIGTIGEGITRPELRQTFADANLLNKTGCKKCWAKYYCSGGCNANNFAFNNSILEPYTISCELEKIRLECAITLQVLNKIAQN